MYPGQDSTGCTNHQMAHDLVLVTFSLLMRLTGPTAVRPSIVIVYKALFTHYVAAIR